MIRSNKAQYASNYQSFNKAVISCCLAAACLLTACNDDKGNASTVTQSEEGETQSSNNESPQQSSSNTVSTPTTEFDLQSIRAQNLSVSLPFDLAGKLTSESTHTDSQSSQDEFDANANVLINNTDVSRVDQSFFKHEKNIALITLLPFKNLTLTSVLDEQGRTQKYTVSWDSIYELDIFPQDSRVLPSKVQDGDRGTIWSHEDSGSKIVSKMTWQFVKQDDTDMGIFQKSLETRDANSSMLLEITETYIINTNGMISDYAINIIKSATANDPIKRTLNLE